MIKVIKINSKRLGVTLILVGLIFVLVAFQKNIDNKLKFTSLIYNNVKSLKEYYMLDNSYVYKLPDNWKTRERKFSGNEIVYHNEFTSDDNVIHGIVQAWNLKGDLKSFLEKSKEMSFEQNVIKDYKSNEIEINKQKCYEITYSLIDKSNNVYKSFEYFIPREGGFIRFSFFVNEVNLKESMIALFESIVKTLQKV